MIRLRAAVVTLWVLAATSAAAQTAAGQQAEVSGLYRMYQGGVEVGRESFRRRPGVTELSVVVPILNLKLDSRTEFDSTGRFRRFTATAYSAAGDSLLGSYSASADGDSIRTLTESRRGAAASVAKAVAGPAAGVIPAQSVAVVALLSRRFGGRDTVVRMLPMGGDSTIPVTISHRGDSSFVTLAGIAARTATTDGRFQAIEVPLSRVRAELWSGRDSLAPLAGLRRPAPDYRAPAGAAFAAEEVQVPVHSMQGDTFSLVGTLTVPTAARRPFPVVVTITGSGQETRDEDLWPLLPDYRPFREIAERLARAGIAVLRMDDRGVGASGGAPGTTADYADDVRQLVAWLRHRTDIAPRRVALLGHSEGGAIGPLAAARDPTIAAIVIMAGPGKPGRAILTDQLTRPVLTAPGLSDSARQVQLALVPQQVERLLAATPWMKWFGTYDPLPTARRLTMPVLILQGALDRQVSAGQADTLAAAIRGAGNRDVTVKVYPGLNHLFLHTDGDGSPTEYPTLADRRLAPEVLEAIATWLQVRLSR